jgi:ferric-dicitrate binding protein FerR (iron transport regulator)
MPHSLFRFTAALAFIAVAAPVGAIPFREAEVTRVHNQVLLIDPGAGRRPAAVRDVVRGDRAVQTGLQSRAELRFPDSTLTRLAANTLFSFREGTREMDLNKGAIFFQVPPGTGGAKIHAAAITAAITGTSGFVERIGDTYKLIVLEGEVRVYMNDRSRESILVRGGQMIIASVKSKVDEGLGAGRHRREETHALVDPAEPQAIRAAATAGAARHRRCRF